MWGGPPPGMGGKGMGGGMGGKGGKGGGFGGGMGGKGGFHGGHGGFPRGPPMPGMGFPRGPMMGGPPMGMMMGGPPRGPMFGGPRPPMMQMHPRPVHQQQFLRHPGHGVQPPPMQPPPVQVAQESEEDRKEREAEEKEKKLENKARKWQQVRGVVSWATARDRRVCDARTDVTACKEQRASATCALFPISHTRTRRADKLPHWRSATPPPRAPTHACPLHMVAFCAYISSSTRPPKTLPRTRLQRL